MTSPPTFSFPVKIHFIFLTNLKTRSCTVSNVFKLLKRLQTIIFSTPNSLHFVIYKALTVHFLILQYKIVLFQIRIIFHSVILENLKGGNTLGLHLHLAMSSEFDSPGIYPQLLLPTFSLIFPTLFFTAVFQLF